MKYRYLVIIIAVLFQSLGFAQQLSIKEQLEQLDNVISVDSIFTDTLFNEQYQVYFEQLIDHNDSSAGVFKQQVILGHVNKKAPMVAVLEGYTIFNARANELTRYFKCNQINVEHRFFKGSRPDSIPWDKLTTWQAATDQHKIIQALKQIYSASWLTTGVSKGGQTTMMQRTYYPNDVDACVAYVAPLNMAREDERIYNFFKTVGTKTQREKVYNFQYQCFQNFDSLRIKFEERAKTKGWTYAMGITKALQYTILEYSFALWQYGGVNPENIPDNTASITELFEHLERISGFTFFEDSSVETYQPFFWAALTEIGMYGYQTKPFSEFLGDTVYTFDFAAPKGTNAVYSDKTVRKVKEYLDHKANNMLFIVGGLDSWGATAYYPSGKNNLVTKVLKEGHHQTSINDFPEQKRYEMYQLLQKWLKVNEPGIYN